MLGNVIRLLIRNDLFGPTAIGEHPAHVTGTLGFDNIEANLVPEPASVTLLGAALALIVVRRRRRKARWE